MKRSEYISNFLNFIADAKREYASAVEGIRIEEKRQTDLVHDIEFCKIAKERNKMTTQLHKCRNTRRKFKDIKEELEPIVDFANEPANKKVIDKLSSQLLGQVRKAENYHENRVYKPRLREVLSEKNINI